MRKIILVGGEPIGACQVRGYQTSQALEKYCSLNAPYILYNQLPPDIKDTVIIFVGEPISYCKKVDDLVKLRKNNNVLIYDIIDNLCFNHTNPFINKELINSYQYLDVMLHPNKLSQYQFSVLLPSIKHVFMPHQWDIRNEDITLYENTNVSKATYIGGIAGGFQLDVNKIKDYVDIYEAPFDVNTYHLQYSVQTSFRKKNSLEYLYKPCTKLAMASSFAAILLTSREPAVIDVVGEAYEFYIDSESDLINQMEKIRSMSTDEINHHKHNTKFIKEYLSPKQNAKRYFDLIKKYI